MFEGDEMTLRATIYVRFSTQEQGLGNSKERQVHLCRKMIERHGWVESPEGILIDEGLSAFKGANRAPGGLLYKFEQEADSGMYRSGHVLVVENLDRISREGYQAVLPFIDRLTNAGVTIATVDGGRIYPAFQRVEMGPVIEAVVKSELAREESAKKSLRIKAAHSKRIAEAQESAARGEHISHTLTVPGWIDTKRIGKSGDRPKYKMTLNTQRAAVLSEIFQLTIDGYGTPAIAKMLNKRGEPVWNHLSRESRHGWTVGYLTKLVLNRAVMGEYHPMNRPRGDKETSKGIAILNHYPQAIDPVTFAKAQAARQSRKGSSGAWQITHSNLFSGIAKCGHCGGRMKQEVTVRKGHVRQHTNGRYPAGQQFSYLKCHNALNRVWDEERGQLRCSNRNWIRYEKIEKALLNVAMKFVIGQRGGHSDTRNSDLRIKIANAQRFIDDKQKRVETLVESFSRTGSLNIENHMLQLEAELLDERAALREMEKGLAAEPDDIPFEEYETRIAALLESIDSEIDVERKEARIRVKQSLRGLITRYECYDDKLTLVELGRAVRVVFDNEGNQIHNEFIGQKIYGPNGEINWHPGFPDADYEFALVD